MATYPDNDASYPLSVRLFRLLPVGLLQCMGHPKPPCHLLMLPGVTLVHKGLAPSGLSFTKLNIVKELLLNLPFKAHTMYIQNRRDRSNFNGYSSLQNCNGLIGLKPAIAYFAYTQRWRALEKTMMTIRNIFKLIIICVTLFLISCNSGYQKENNIWTWVSYDEAVGKREGIIAEADVETFVVLENEKYAKDKNNVYFIGGIIEFADPSTFDIINDIGYSKDTKNVYLDWDIVINSDPNTFLVLDWPYSKDKENVFCGNLPLNISDPNRFVVTKIGSGKTTTLKSHFIELNPDYDWLDTVQVNGIITGEGEGETQTEKFIGYKKK